MSVSAAKRSLDLVSSSSLAQSDDSVSHHDEVENDHIHDDMHDNDDNDQPRRKGSKTSKKQDLDPETKLKRTAQNRAAQRAFRERKERKMKELEKKVHSLESIQQENEVEATFLRDQLVTLVSELKKYRPETRNDSKVLEYLARRDPNLHPPNSNTNNNSEPIVTPNDDIQKNVKQKMNFTFQYPLDNDDNDGKNMEKQLPSPNDPNHSAHVPIAPTQKKLSDATDSSTATLDSFSNNNDVLNITPNSSSSMDWLDNVMYTNKFVAGGDQKNANNESKSKPKGVDSNMFSNDFNFENQFDEQVSEFCSKMNQACGTKQCPIPKKSVHQLDKEVFASSSVLSANSPVLTNTWDSHSNVTTNTPANITTNGSSSSSFGQPGFDLNTNHYATNDKYTDNSDNNKTNNYNDILPFISESPFDMNQVTNFFSPGTNNTTNANTTNSHNPSLQQSTKDDIPFINTSLAFPDDNPTNIQLQPLSQSQHQNKFDYDMFFRDSSKEGNNLFEEFLEEDDDDDDDDGNDGNDNDGEAVNASDDESNLIKNKLINEEPQQQSQCHLSTPKNGSEVLQNKNSSNSEDVNDNDNEVVPSKEGSLLRCSEIWDRITTHPKYSDIDVDGLCSELMAKAKCSERGVVINAEDVQLALNKHMN